jgi:hypothetical protein
MEYFFLNKIPKFLPQNKRALPGRKKAGYYAGRRASKRNLCSGGGPL